MNLVKMVWIVANGAFISFMVTAVIPFMVTAVIPFMVDGVIVIAVFARVPFNLRRGATFVGRFFVGECGGSSPEPDPNGHYEKRNHCYHQPFGKEAASR
jgi:hypothetical protein